jgi:hypothetical protein
VGSGTLSMDDGQGYKTNPNLVDHRAQAYVAPLKKPLVQSHAENTTETSTIKVPGGWAHLCILYGVVYLSVFLSDPGPWIHVPELGIRILLYCTWTFLWPLKKNILSNTGNIYLFLNFFLIFLNK